MGRKKDQEIAEVVSNLGFAFELLKVIANAVIDKGGTMDHLRRIVNEPELQNKIAEFTIGSEKVQRGSVRVESFVTHVEYGIRRKDLKSSFFIALAEASYFLNSPFYGGESVSREDRELTFEYFHIVRDTEPDEIISAMEQDGLRPALFEELVAFAKAHPEEIRRAEVMAIGSKCQHNVYAYACMDEGRLCLRGYELLEESFHAGRLFLAVRKEAQKPANKEPEKFSVSVVYEQPDYDELKRRFNGVSSGSFRKFEAIESCAGISTENREIVFEYVHMHCEASTKEVLAEMDRRGLRPALYEELLSFAEKYSDEQLKHPIVALGSEKDVSGYSCVAYLWYGDNGRILRLYRVDDIWRSDNRFLAVRKETPKPADKEPENTTAEEELPPDHYRVHMSYKGMPSYEELKKEWGEDCVSSFFDGRTITLHESCQDMDRTPGEKIFYLHDAGTEWWESEEQIVWGRRQCSRIAPYGYRPATHEEVYEFAKAHPELANFVGLGSFVVKGVQARCSANVCLTAGARILFDMHFYSGSHRGERILFVAK